jgi:hypothetical protein
MLSARLVLPFSAIARGRPEGTARVDDDIEGAAESVTARCTRIEPLASRSGADPASRGTSALQSAPTG